MILIYLKGSERGRRGVCSYGGKCVTRLSHNGPVLQLTGVLTLCISESLAAVPALLPGGEIWTHTAMWGDSGFWACQADRSFLFADEGDACPLGRGKLDEWLSQNSGNVHAADSGVDSNSHPASVQPLHLGVSLGQQHWQGMQKLGQKKRDWKKGIRGKWTSHSFLRRTCNTRNKHLSFLQVDIAHKRCVCGYINLEQSQHC